MACVSTAATVSFTCSPTGGRLYKDNVLWISNVIDQFSNCVDAGYHTFRYEADGYRPAGTQSYNYPAGVDTHIYFTLEPESGNGCDSVGDSKIIFTLSPPGGELYVDDTYMGSPGSSYEMCIIGGIYTFEYRKDGYLTQETQSYNYLGSQTYNVYFNLPVTNGCSSPTTQTRVELITYPIGAQSYIDGNYVDHSVPFCVDSGTHTLLVQADGYIPHAETIYLYPGQSWSHGVTLDPILCVEATRECLTTTTYKTCINGNWDTSGVCPTGQGCSGGVCSSPSACATYGCSTSEGCVPVNVSPYGSKLYVNNTQVPGFNGSGTLCLLGGTTFTLKAEYPGYYPDSETITITAGQKHPVVSLVCTSDTTCVNGQEKCSSTGVPQLCVNNKWVDQTPCVAPQVCVGGDCTLNKICTPGKKRCNGKVPQTCNTAGTAWVDGTACTSTCTGEGVCTGDTTHPCSTTYPTGYCTDPTKVCKNGVCTTATAACDGMNRNGSFDFTCILDEQNKMLLYGAIALVGILLIKK